MLVRSGFAWRGVCGAGLPECVVCSWLMARMTACPAPCPPKYPVGSSQVRSVLRYSAPQLYPACHNLHVSVCLPACACRPTMLTSTGSSASSTMSCPRTSHSGVCCASSPAQQVCVWGGGAGVGVPSLQVSHVLPSLLTACAPSEASHSMHAQHMQMHVSLCFSPLLACAVPTACLLFAMFFNLLTRLLSMHMCPVPPPLHRPCPSGGGGACCV